MKALVLGGTRYVGLRATSYSDWPVEEDLVVPLESLPEHLKESMGSAWRLRLKNQKVLDEQSKK